MRAHLVAGLFTHEARKSDVLQCFSGCELASRCHQVAEDPRRGVKSFCQPVKTVHALGCLSFLTTHLGVILALKPAILRLPS